MPLSVNGGSNKQSFLVLGGKQRNARQDDWRGRCWKRRLVFGDFLAKIISENDFFFSKWIVYTCIAAICLQTRILDSMNISCKVPKN
jgi:hypothetical protein